MKKLVILLLILILIGLIIVCVNINNIKVEKQKILNYNKEYEFYLDKEILGTDITTLINKATNNNEKYEISKTESGNYIADEKNSVLIFIKMKSSDKIFPMESFNEVGMNKFISYFGSTSFKAVDVQYHENGKISSIKFEEV